MGGQQAVGRPGVRPAAFSAASVAAGAGAGGRRLVSFGCRSFQRRRAAVAPSPRKIRSVTPLTTPKNGPDARPGIGVSEQEDRQEEEERIERRDDRPPLLVLGIPRADPGIRAPSPAGR